MYRRRFLTTLGAGVGFTLAGCSMPTNTGSGGSTDTDGDGVPDQYDYAPRDPEVQSKQDGFGRATPTPTPPPTTTPTPHYTFNLDGMPTPSETPTEVPTFEFDWEEYEETTPTETPTFEFDWDEYEGTPPTSEPNQSLPDTEIQADVSAINGRTSHFSQYSMRSATVELVPETIEKSYSRGARLLIFASAYPDEWFADDEPYGYGLSAPFSLSTTTKQTVPLTFEETPGVSFYLTAYIMPGNETMETVDIDTIEYLGETNRLRVEADRLISEEPVPDTTDFAATGFSRESVEGCYMLEFEGTEGFQSWTANFVAYKSNYVETSMTLRDSNRASYVTRAQESGLADALAVILDEAAESNGFTTKRERVRFVIEFVQNLPYVPDDVSTGYDDYTKSVTETLVEGGGDCEDTSILMAAVLQAEAFNYDCILIQPPGHMAVGVYGDDLPGTYWEKNGREYYYLETTGDGWDIGEIPEEYEYEQAYLYDV